MKAGIGTYAFTWAIGVSGSPPASPMDVHAFLSESARLEAEVCQIGDNIPLPQLDAEALHRIREQAENLGLEIEVGGRGLTVDNAKAYARVALALGAKLVRMVVDGPGYRPTVADALDVLKAALPGYERTGTSIAIENHDRFSSAELLNFIRRASSPLVGICLDTVNSLGAGEDAVRVVETLGPYAKCLHVKDFTIRRASHTMGFIVEGASAGQGQLPLPWLLGKLREAGVKANAILEDWVPPGDNLAETIDRERSWAEHGMRHLRYLLRP